MDDLEAQLAQLLARYPAPLADLGRAARAWLRARLPGLHEIVYHYAGQDALVVSWSPTGHGYDGLVSLRVDPARVRLHFARGGALPDPARLLRGRGDGVRHLDLAAATDLDRPELEALLAAALALAGVRPDPTTSGKLLSRVESQQARRGRG